MEKRLDWKDWLWLVAFGVASSIWCITAARTIGATFDEPTYLENGLHFWRTGSHRTLMRLGTMPLPVDLQTLPLGIAERIRGQGWNVDTDFERLLPWMRHGNLVFWWLLLFSSMRIGRDIGGIWGGRIAVAIVACEPNLLAHAALATTDIAITATILTFAFYFQRGRDEAWSRRVGLAGVWYGIALLSKASAMVFGPLAMLAIEIVRRWGQPAAFLQWRSFIRDSIGIGLVGFAVALVGVGSDFQPEESFVRWAKQLPAGSTHDTMLWIAEHLCIFGNAAEGLVMQVKHNLRGHGQFLLGESSTQPFWYYFPVVFAIKLTLPMLAATLLLVLRPRWVKDNWPLVCAALMLVFSLTCRVQIGIRLQLAAVAFLAIGLAAFLARGLEHNRRGLVIASAFGVTWIAVSSAFVWPHGLCYVNELWGGTPGGYRLVSDGNYDWGQGLPELAKWQHEHNAPLDIWYYGRDPQLKRMSARDLPLHCVPLHRPADVGTFCWGRYLAVGTTIRYGHILNDQHRFGVEFLKNREPIARTTTFLIYDLTDLGPPKPSIETAQGAAP